MATMTLLEMTQNILSAMDSDPVDSITDTAESVQVATVIQETFHRLMSMRDWPFNKGLTTLTETDASTPTEMTIPADLSKIYWVKYNKLPITWLDPEVFQYVLDLRTELTDVVDANGFVLNRDPTYWTSFDDTTVVFDGYNADDEDFLATANSNIYVLFTTDWTHEDDFTPAIPEKFFPTFLADAKGTCFLNLKQQANAKEERIAKLGRMTMNNEAVRVNYAETVSNDLVNFGRK